MRRGYLSEYFEGVAMKRLSAVEADSTRSNQHEYNATRDMLTFMGRPSTSTRLPARFIYIDDDSNDPIIEDAFLTLYDSRENQPHRSAEYRFYFPTTTVSQNTNEGDVLVIAKRRDEGLLVIVAASGSTAVSQLEWLFGFNEDSLPRFAVRTELDDERYNVGFAASVILESIGIDVSFSEEHSLEALLERFGGSFPKTADFSAYARESLHGIDPRDDPDAALMTWIERETALFYTLERYLIERQLAEGFGSDQVEGFLKYSKSIQQRRRSRIGYALENHLEVVFTSLGIKYKRTAVTENKTKPDFLFPGQDEYHDATFDPLNLSILAVKSTCKDRWRQVLAEADRIEDKHLLTLETAISANQTAEMQAKRLQLVLPKSLHPTYTDEQQAWLFDIAEFSRMVLERQQRA